MDSSFGCHESCSTKESIIMRELELKDKKLSYSQHFEFHYLLFYVIYLNWDFSRILASVNSSILFVSTIDLLLAENLLLNRIAHSMSFLNSENPKITLEVLKNQFEDLEINRLFL